MKAFSIFACALALLAPVSAQAFICQADPAAGLGVDQTGTLLVNVEGIGVVAICSMSATDPGGTTKEGCAAWFSALLTWRATRTKALLYFNPATPPNSGITSCAGFAAWERRAPYYIEAAS